MRQQALKIDRTKLRVQGRPFDTSYNVRGNGISEGQDFPNSMLQMFDFYRFKRATRTGKGKLAYYTLFGTLNRKMFRKYLLSTSYRHVAKSPVRARLIQSLSDMLAHMTIRLNAWSLKPMQIRQGTAKSKVKARVIYKNIRVNIPLPKNIFRYTFPKGLKVKDITATLVQRRKQMQQSK